MNYLPDLHVQCGPVCRKFAYSAYLRANVQLWLKYEALLSAIRFIRDTAKKIAPFGTIGFTCFELRIVSMGFNYGRIPAVFKVYLLEFYGIWLLRDWNMAQFASQCQQ